MSYTDVIVIGAGAAGLMAANVLSMAGKSVQILEGNNRPGGRIYTAAVAGFREPVQLGAEFIHGNLPLTLELLREAGIRYHKVEGAFIRFQNGRMAAGPDPSSGIGTMLEAAAGLDQDMALNEFLETYFPGEARSDFRSSMLAYAEGYNAADPAKASVLQLLEEWENEDEDQYRINAGYGSLISYLEQKCLAQGCLIKFSSAVRSLNWEPGNAAVDTSGGETFRSSRVIVTVPQPLLSCSDAENYIKFDPPVPGIHEAAGNIGFGPVLKIVMQFKKPFWKIHPGTVNMQMLFSEEKVPTWWTQSPAESNVLTGWLAGPKARAVNTDETDICQASLQSPSAIFGISAQELSGELTGFSFCDWKSEPFALGAYSYTISGQREAKARLSEPVSNTIYFAGEAAYNGNAPGTVEAALVSGKNTANMII